MEKSFSTGVTFCHGKILLGVAQADWPEGLSIVLGVMKRDILYSRYINDAIEAACVAQATNALREFVRYDVGNKYQVSSMLEKHGNPATLKEMFFYLSGSARKVLTSLLNGKSDADCKEFLAKLGRDEAITDIWADYILSSVADTRPDLYRWLSTANLRGFPTEICVSHILSMNEPSLLRVLVDNGASAAGIAAVLLHSQQTALAFQFMASQKLFARSTAKDRQALAFELMSLGADVHPQRIKPLLEKLIEEGIDIHAEQGKLMFCALRNDKSQMLARCLIENGFDIDAYQEDLNRYLARDKVALDFIKTQSELQIKRNRYREQGYKIVQEDMLVRSTDLGGATLLQVFNFTTGKMLVTLSEAENTTGKVHNADWMLGDDGYARLAGIFTALGGDPRIAARAAPTTFDAKLGAALRQPVAHKKPVQAAPAKTPAGHKKSPK
jgi:hypothetical protein